MSIWFKDFTMQELEEYEKKRENKFIHDTLGIKYTEIGEDFLRGTMPVDERTHQPMGIMHGGASCVLAESLGSYGAALTLDNTKQHCVGLDIHTTHIRSVSSGIVTGTARPIHIGRSTQVWNIDIVDERGKLVSITRLNMFVKDNQK